MNLLKRKRPESPDELEREGYVQTADFMRWVQKNSSHLLLREVEVLMDLARGDSVHGPHGHFFIEEHKRELLFSRLNRAIKVGEELGASQKKILPIALTALNLEISKFERIRNAS